MVHLALQVWAPGQPPSTRQLAIQTGDAVADAGIHGGCTRQQRRAETEPWSRQPYHMGINSCPHKEIKMDVGTATDTVTNHSLGSRLKNRTCEQVHSVLLNHVSRMPFYSP